MKPTTPTRGLHIRPTPSSPGRAFAFLFALAFPCAAEVVVTESFGGTGGALNGTTTDSGEGLEELTWTAGPVFLDNGTVGPVAAAATGQSAYLPYFFEPLKIYKLKATLTNNSPEWIAVGFSTAANNSTEQVFSVRHSNSGAYAWILTRNQPTGNDQEAFNGPGATNGVVAATGDLADPTAPITVEIHLDTSASVWTVRYFYNGTQYGDVQNLPVAASSAITGFGFSRTGTATASTGGTLSSLSLEVEPVLDSDNDDLPDEWELLHFRENDEETVQEILAKYDSFDDPDGDLNDNYSEFINGTDPNDIFSSSDSDADGLPDGYEVFWFRASEEEELFDIIEKYSGADDPDGDGFTNAAEFAARTTANPGGTDPLDASFTPLDSDGDGLVDAWEIFRFGDLSETATGDPDNDTFDNLAEQNAGSDPDNAASTPLDADANGVADASEPMQPYTADSATLHLWHLDEVKAPALDAGPEPLPLTSLANGAQLWTPSRAGFGTALNPAAGRGTATSGVLSALPLADGDTDNATIAYAGENGAFTFEAIVRIDFDPAAPPNPAVPMQIVTGEGDTAGNRVWQFRIQPTAGAPALQFINLHGEVDIETFSADIPTGGSPDAIVQGSWYHVAVAYNGAENTPENLRFYWTLLDPNRTAANAIFAGQMVNDLISATPDFTIGNEGRATGGTTDAFAGAIDEVRISSVARTAGQFLFRSEGDSDGDGMDDAWEESYFGDLSQGATDDFDGDGTDNLTEFRLGLLPDDGSSRFAASRTIGGEIRWPGKAGLSFTIERSTTLAPGGWDPIATVPGTDGINTYTDPEPPAGKAFYRVRLDG